MSGPFGVTFTFTYDTAGNRLTATDNKGGTLTSTYDALNRLSSRSLSSSGGATTAAFAYTARGQLAAMSQYSPIGGVYQGDTAAYSYNDDGTLSAVVDSKSATPFFVNGQMNHQRTPPR